MPNPDAHRMPNASSGLPRRAFVAMLAAAGLVRLPRFPEASWLAGRPVPSPSQLEWQRDELAMFLHFGVNTFTNREWGEGKEDPAVFAPTNLDAGQWARVAKAAGFRTMILTAKHHDGFCLWPTATTTHSVASSPFRGGKGDVVREFTDACKAAGLKAGLYLSPWDRNHPAYGDSPRYNDVYCAQLTELLTHYGPIHEVWFDGANGEGPNGKRQVYDWPRVWALVRKLQPKAVMFSDAGPDVRWIGNESGTAGEMNWSMVNPGVVSVPGVSGNAVMQQLQHGDPSGTVWRPGETDVSIRPGWFHHAAEDARVRTVENLVGLYFTSVGRNSKLLLNVPPTRDGWLHHTDAERLAGMHERLQAMFAHDLTKGKKRVWQRTGARSATTTIDLFLGNEGISVIDLGEDISKGQLVTRYAVEGLAHDGWVTLSKGTTIGYRKLDRISPAHTSLIRVTIEDALDTPQPLRIALYPGS